MQQAISVIKKRHGAHEKTIREIRITTAGIQVGEPLVDFSGVLSGQPHYEGEPGQLLHNHSDKNQ